MYRFIRQSFEVLREVFSGYFLFVHLFVVGLTVLFVFSGGDWWWYQITRNTIFLPVVFFAGIAGFLVPIILPVTVYVFGKWRREDYLRKTAYTLAVAEFSSLVIAATYKAITGRLQPNLANGVDISHAFQFGFMKHGIFWGWPSSHTIVAFAGAVVIIFMIRSRWVRFILLLYAVVVGLGASIGFHWLSDVVAGALLGSAVAFIARRETSKVIE